MVAVLRRLPKVPVRLRPRRTAVGENIRVVPTVTKLPLTEPRKDRVRPGWRVHKEAAQLKGKRVATVATVGNKCLPDLCAGRPFSSFVTVVFPLSLRHRFRLG